jgi:hypothetical protein
MTTNQLSTQVIGAAGELLVQYQLLKHGIDSARLTTDSGIDLVMYVPGTSEAFTVQVKAIGQPFADGGPTGPITVGWSFPRTCKAQWLAGVDVSRDMVWLFRIEEALQLAKGNTADVFLYWRLQPNPRGRIEAENAFERYRFDNVIASIVGEAVADETEGGL